jgi:hypothetical protein
MHRRLAAIVGALVLALASVGAVSADTAGPSGSNLYMEWTDCHGTTCTYASFEVDVLKKGTTQACLFLTDGTNSGQGCTSDFGALTYSGKFIVGIDTTTVNVANFGTVTFSATSTMTEAPHSFSGCASGDSWKGDVATVAGTLTVNSDSGDATGETNVHVTRAAKRC